MTVISARENQRVSACHHSHAAASIQPKCIDGMPLRGNGGIIAGTSEKDPASRSAATKLSEPKRYFGPAIGKKWYALKAQTVNTTHSSSAGGVWAGRPRKCNSATARKLSGVRPYAIRTISGKPGTASISDTSAGVMSIPAAWSQRKAWKSRVSGWSVAVRVRAAWGVIMNRNVRMTSQRRRYSNPGSRPPLPPERVIRSSRASRHGTASDVARNMTTGK